MFRLFDIIPPNFFNIFNPKCSSYRDVIIDCIIELYEYTKQNTAFTAPKDSVIYLLTRYFDIHILNIEDNDDIPRSLRDRALDIYRRMKEYGWISENHGSDFAVTVIFDG